MVLIQLPPRGGVSGGEAAEDPGGGVEGGTGEVGLAAAQERIGPVGWVRTPDVGVRRSLC